MYNFEEINTDRKRARIRKNASLIILWKIFTFMKKEISAQSGKFNLPNAAIMLQL